MHLSGKILFDATMRFGVPQGSVPGEMFFLLDIADIKKTV